MTRLIQQKVFSEASRCQLALFATNSAVKEKSDKEHFPPLFRVDLPSFFASAATLGFLGVFRVLTKVFFCMAGSSRVLNWRFRAIPSQEACQTRIDSTAVLDPLKNNSLAQKMEST
jgi:hypothetical protein